ncbi:MAG: 4Fe-4S dicluster domain-containing protein [Chloroflexi bacterium]|nr:4Fe-4S dicluster domain-containing protein [Chloroflexota bacterium]
MPVDEVIVLPTSKEFRVSVEKESGQPVLRCFQCGKCTSGCPVSYAMDLTPRQVMRAVQLGLKEEALKSQAIRLCVSCHTCTVRCPVEIEIPAVMEALLHLSATEGVRPAEKNVALFQRLFLSLLEQNGRAYEFGLGMGYNLIRHDFFANAGLVPAMLSRGKLSLLPPSTREAKEIKAIFAKVSQIEGRLVAVVGGQREEKVPERAFYKAVGALGAVAGARGRNRRRKLGEEQ